MGLYLKVLLSGIISGDIVDISNIYTTDFIDIYVGTNKLMYINKIIRHIHFVVLR